MSLVVHHGTGWASVVSIMPTTCHTDICAPDSSSKPSSSRFLRHEAGTHSNDSAAWSDQIRNTNHISSYNKPLTCCIFVQELQKYNYISYHLLRLEISQVTEILHCERQKPVCPAQSKPWLLMSWCCKEAGHQQKWYWPSSPGIFDLQHQMGKPFISGIILGMGSAQAQNDPCICRTIWSNT